MLTCYLFPFLTEFSHLPENRSFSSKTIHSISRALLSFICSVCPQILPIDERHVGERALSLQDPHPHFWSNCMSNVSNSILCLCHLPSRQKVHCELKLQSNNHPQPKYFFYSTQLLIPEYQNLLTTQKSYNYLPPACFPVGVESNRVSMDQHPYNH